MKRIALLVVVALLVGVNALAAQAQKTVAELRPLVGVSIPTGAQREVFRDGAMFGLQGAVEIAPFLHALGTVGWVAASDKYHVLYTNANILSYNAGIELGPVTSLPGEWLFMPFAGIGGGARTYLYSASGLSDQTCVAGYGALGVEFKVNITAFRLEARDNVFCYRSPLAGGASSTRNDVGLTLGVAYHMK